MVCLPLSQVQRGLSLKYGLYMLTDLTRGSSQGLMKAAKSTSVKAEEIGSPRGTGKPAAVLPVQQAACKRAAGLHTMVDY